MDQKKVMSPKRSVGSNISGFRKSQDFGHKTEKTDTNDNAESALGSMQGGSRLQKLL